MVKNVLKLFVVFGIISTIFLFNAADLNSATSKTNYFVTVEHIDCYDANGNLTGETSRTETWRKSSNGDPIYQVHKDCSGKTTTSGKKPMVVEGRGNDLWEIAVNKSNMLNIPIATALAMDYPPKFDSSGSNGSKSYEFEFLLDWVYSYDVSLTASNLTFSTDFNDIYIKLVDLTAGTDITSFILVNNTQTIDISTLPIGCRYSIMMYVYDDEVLTPIATNYNFCKEGNGNN